LKDNLEKAAFMFQKEQQDRKTNFQAFADTIKTDLKNDNEAHQQYQIDVFNGIKKEVEKITDESQTKNKE